MSKYREIVYMVLDLLKIYTDDSLITEDHIIWLANNYRGFLLKQRYLSDSSKKVVPQSNYQTICIDLCKADKIDGIPCEGQILRSEKEIPNIMPIGNTSIYPYDAPFDTNITYVSKNRIKYVGHNKWMNNIIYASKGDNQMLYLTSLNPLFLYLLKVRVNAIFENPEEAFELQCDKSICDIMDSEFPLESALIPPLIDLIIKDLGSTLYLPVDEDNNSNDDLSVSQQRLNRPNLELEL